MNTKALVESLKKHYGEHLSDRQPFKVQGFIMEEVMSPDGHRRADALYIYTSSKDRGKIVGYELKVSRADLLSELNDPTKAETWAQYCTEWWLLVSDPALVEGMEDKIPEYWGIATPPTGKGRVALRVIRPAGVRQVSQTTMGFASIVAKLFYTTVIPSRQVDYEVQSLRNRHASLLGEVDKLRKRHEVPYDYEKYLRLKEKLDGFPWLSDDDIIDFVKRFRQFQLAEQDLKYRARMLGSVFKDIGKQQKKMEELFPSDDDK